MTIWIIQNNMTVWHASKNQKVRRTAINCIFKILVLSSGHIINMSSVASSIKGAPNRWYDTERLGQSSLLHIAVYIFYSQCSFTKICTQQRYILILYVSFIILSLTSGLLTERPRQQWLVSQKVWRPILLGGRSSTLSWSSKSLWSDQESSSSLSTA